ncbi:dihydroxyacetone kinase subunit DhaL [Pseudomonas syringae]|uniref:dihydroxyacetone kinase subunit DhaL n=1 Tax=Pseudomonas syringae TaxID=317 RepID=UPI0006E63080|nr:dihydroxyacetone kinase subunit DhaL [Pseudomonas syringae]KPY45361.1 Dihydroxyacetone kinase, ATP-dependent [Pseudomonas syringae pv. rhaphiolepidis]KWS45725.1 dihydroxyacetone kinase [Pseudomonas syringae pv. rhaphiolepidis]
MKKIINNPNAVVSDMLEGVVLSDDRLVLLSGEDIIVRKDFREQSIQGKVSIISGGGSGHEPAHGGYVGPGMLTAAVAGPVFTSPSVDAILNAILTVAGPAGVLLIVKSYTGDRLNFGLAAEIARSSGVKVDMVVVGDDVALDGEGRVGRRGIAGTVFIHKIAGAAAQAGLSLESVKAEAQKAAQGLFTMGLGLSACTVPAAGKPGFALEDDQVEFGLGIHGESGVRRSKIDSAEVMIRSLVSRIVEQGQLQIGDRVALMVNNLGGSSAQELDIAARQALIECSIHGLKVEKAMVGTFLTALEMAGVSLTLLRVDDAILSYLISPAETSAWKGLTTPALEVTKVVGASAEQTQAVSGATWSSSCTRSFKEVIKAVTHSLQQSEQILTELDSVVGDGDIGISLARGARAIDDSLALLTLDKPAVALQEISAILRRVLGGTSGPLYAMFVLRAGTALAGREDVTSVSAWAAALQAGCDGMKTLGGAAAGDRTMLDALIPAADFLATANGALPTVAAGVAEAAENGSEQTRSMLPMKGRSSYIGQRALGHVDPGAYAVTVWMKAIADTIKRL